jgi:hypothetical protein
MRYTTTLQGHLELIISDVADWAEFERIAEAICIEFRAQIVVRLDGLDERYWDLRLSDQLVTLHLQHYLGICLFAESVEAEIQVRHVGRFLESTFW